MTISDVYTRKVYEENGEKKARWYKVGYVKTTDTGKRYMRFFHNPELEYFIFDKESLPTITS